MGSLMRGASPSPRHKLAAAMPHKATTPAPAQFMWELGTLSMWYNDQDGDCVTAEEAFAKGCGPAGVFIEDATVLAWANANGVLNGADLSQVLTLMQSGGFDQDGTTYDDGPPTSVDWTNGPVLQNAISQGPVKIGVAADQLENTVQAFGIGQNGWIAIGYTEDENLDHCVSLCGYGTFGWLAEQLGVTLPAGVDPTAFGYALYTWKSVGLIDQASLNAICGEAWLRNPTTVAKVDNA